MSHTSTVVPRPFAVVEPIDRAAFQATTMGKPFSSSENRTMKDSGEHQASRLPSAHVDSMHSRPGVTATYTLRIKPDRRRAKAPIAPGSDRRRSH
jgi:hypothetical protein